MPARTPAVEVTYSAEMVWACAAAADRINCGYRKNSDWSFDPDTGETVEHPANKSLVLQFLTKHQFNALSKTEVTDEDFANGQKAREFWQSQMLLLLDDKANQYLKSCTTAAHKETIDSHLDIAVIASCIVAARREARKQELADFKNSLNSQWVCGLNQGVEFKAEINVFEVRHVEKVGSYAVECVVDGNLYTWWSNSKVEPGVYSFLKARVKAHKVDYQFGVPVTQLNYVKISK